MQEETMGRPVRRSRGRRAAALAGVVLAFGAVAGCGGGGSSASPSNAATAQPSAAAPSTTPTATASGSSAAPAPEPRPVSPSASASATPAPGPATTATPGIGPSGPGIAPGEPPPGGRQTISYQLNGNQLTIWFYGGICDTYGLKTDESQAGRVGIQVVVATPAPAGRACAAIAKRQSVTGELKKPLMGRTVVDTGNGAEVPLESEYHGGPVPADQ